MKKISISIITLVLIFSGCTEWITLQPQDELIREEYWKTEDDVVNVLGQAYAKMSSVLDEIYYWNELRGGLISPEPKKVGPEFLEFFNFNINQYNDEVKWGDFYVIIGLANTILEYAPDAKSNDQTFTDEAYDGYIAEAYYIRSLCYFYLVKAFQEVPFIRQSYSKDDQDFNYEKSSEQEILDQLIIDLNAVVNQAFKTSDFISAAEKKGRVTVNAFYALLADIYLWSNDYQNCIASCDKISGVFLVPGEEYFSIYGGQGNSTESIFELQFDYNLYRTTNEYDNDDHNLYTMTSNNSQGNKETLVSELLTALYNINDLRQTDKDDANVTYTKSVYSIWKYEGQTPYNDADLNRSDRTRSRSDANWIFYRLSEIHLMKAEAYAEMDNIGLALEQLNIVRIRAGLAEYTDINKRKLLGQILDERAKELVGEGKRWFDLIRIARRDINTRLVFISEAVISNVDPRSRSAVATKIKDMNSWYLPIHYDELVLNKKLVQNPFYE